MAQLSPGVGPFPFAITIRDATGGAFIPDRVVFPQVLDPISRNSDGTPTATDLGGQSAAAPLSSGTYFIYNLTFSLAANALPGNYTIGSTTSSVPGVGGRYSVISDLSGNNTFPDRCLAFQHHRGARARFVRPPMPRLGFGRRAGLSPAYCGAVIRPRALGCFSRSDSLGIRLPTQRLFCARMPLFCYSWRSRHGIRYTERPSAAGWQRVSRVTRSK